LAQGSGLSISLGLQRVAVGAGMPSAMPTRFTSDGENVSPPLRWSGVPEDATELRISLTDRDAPRGTFTHWLVTGVDRATSKVEEGAVPVGGTEGRNDFGDTGYGGPCPPAGAPHRYVFTVEALDAAGTLLDRDS
jgi:Raf kinase inhibitor-like YbhB/YbcL family protein